MIGLEATAGAVRWKQVGAARNCESINVISETVGDEDFRCRYRSGKRVVRDDELSLVNIGVNLERFDHTTGKAKWRVATDAFSTDDWEQWSIQVRLLDDHHVLARQRRKPINVDLRDGTVAAAESDLPAWCLGSESLPYALPYTDDAPRLRTSGTLVDQCDATGSRTKIVQLPPASVSAEVGDVRAVTGTRAVTGVRKG